MKTLPTFLRLVFWCVVLMGGGLLSSPHHATAQSAEVLYLPAQCAFPIPDGYTVDCGNLVVPQNRDLPAGRKVQLHAAYFHSTNPNPPDDPILYLVGGPGVSLLYDIEILFYHFEVYLQNRDVIVYDQRGTGYSIPALQCGDFGGGSYADYLEQCATIHTIRGADLEAFNSVESAADAEDLRLALGIRQWNVVGVSYGTRLAQVIGRDYPDGVRTVILDSVAPLGEVDYSRHEDDRGWVRQILQDCEADAACAAAYPDIVTTFDTLWRELRVPTTITTDAGRVTLNRDLFAGYAWQWGSSHDGARRLPAIIAAAAEGDFVPLLSYSTSYTVFDMMNIAVNCNDGNVGGGQCEAAGIVVGPALDADPIAFDTPTLIVNGRWDNLTPTESAEAVFRQLPQAIFVEFPYLSHGIVRSGDSCAVGMAFSFLDRPDAPVDTACVAQTIPQFYIAVDDATPH